MPRVEPVPAIVYGPAGSKGADVSSLIAPPYDVLDEAARAALLAQDGRNIVADSACNGKPAFMTRGPTGRRRRGAEEFRVPGSASI